MITLLPSPTSLPSLFSVWFSLCTLLVVKRTELCIVFYAFTISFILHSLISGGKCHPHFPSSSSDGSNDSNHKTTTTTLDNSSNDVTQRMNNTITKSLVGLIMFILSSITLSCQRHLTSFPSFISSNNNTVEFYSVALLTGYLSFDLCHAPYCYHPPLSFSYLLRLMEDTLSLVLFVIALVWHVDHDTMTMTTSDSDETMATFDLASYRESLMFWLAYKSLRLVGSIIMARRTLACHQKYNNYNNSVTVTTTTGDSTTALIATTPTTIKNKEMTISSSSKTNTTNNHDAVTNVADSSQLWTIHGVSYDLSEFVDRHPGGKDAIELGRGRDCTALFESYHPFTNKHRTVLQRYAPPNTTPNPPLDPFYETLKNRVTSTLLHHNIDPSTPQRTATTPRLLYYTTILFLLPLAAYHHLHSHLLYGSLPFASLSWLIGSLGHDGGHFAVSSGRFSLVNTLSCLVGMSLLCNPIMWQHQHTYAHHSHTNEFDHDPDLHHFTLFLRVHERFSSSGGYRRQRQRWYVYLAYAFVVFGTCLWVPLGMLREGSLYGMVEWTDKRDYKKFGLMVGHLMCYFGVVVVGPLWLALTTGGTGESVWGWCWRMMTAVTCVVVHIAMSGLLFAFFSQINHLNEASLREEEEAEEQEMVITKEDEQEDHEEKKEDEFDDHHSTPNTKIDDIKQQKTLPSTTSWAARQVRTSNNFATSSHLWHILSNGLNLQIEHHLFPSLNHCHLHLIAPDVKRTCEEFGVLYKSYETWSELMDASLLWYAKLAADEEERDGGDGGRKVMERTPVMS